MVWGLSLVRDSIDLRVVFSFLDVINPLPRECHCSPVAAQWGERGSLSTGRQDRAGNAGCAVLEGRQG